MKALLLASLAILALALPPASEAQVYARGGNVNFNRGGFAGRHGVAVVRGARVVVAQPRVVVVRPQRRVGFFGRVRAGVQGFRRGR